MEKYLTIIRDSYAGYAGHLWNQITNPGWGNYFYMLVVVSAFFFLLEILRPWRENQPKFRKDFWLDFFYMFFNFFLFSLIIYNAASSVVVNLFNDFLGLFGIKNLVAIQIGTWAIWLQLLTLFVIRDFIQWWTHRLLHRVDFLWEFHKVHHSVEQMGFAAHLRYHWMENVVYGAIQYIPLAMIGFGIDDFFIVYFFTTMVGHYNHTNITVSGRVSGAVLGFLIGIYVIYQVQLPIIQEVGVIIGIIAFAAFVVGPFMKIIFNSPEMHIWHHTYNLPEDRRYGINFALTLAIWDYIFGTAHIPHDGRDIKLGFPGVEDFPTTFVQQNLHGWGKDGERQTVNDRRRTTDDGR